MKIYFFVSDMSGRGGTERTTALLANTFVRKGHDVSIVSLIDENKDCVYELDSKLDLVYLATPSPNYLKTRINRLFLLLRAFIKILLNYSFKDNDSIIICQGFLSSVFVWFSLNANRSIACEHYKYEVYNSALRAFRNFIYKSFMTVVVLTDNDAKRFKLHKVNAYVIPNMTSFGIKPNRVANARRMITVGRLHPQKGYDLLLSALVSVFERYPDWYIDIYADGDEAYGLFLKKQVSDLNLQSNVFFKEFCTDIQKEYLNSSFYVMSSRYEGFPMTLLEAMACGLPVVSFQCPEGTAELLKDNVGLLVPPEDVTMLSEAIIRMIRDEKLRANCTAKGLNVIQAYTPDKVYIKWLTLFENIKENR